MMNSSNYDHLPIEIRNNIYTYIPQRKCVVCKKITPSFNDLSKNISICSLVCLYSFNARITKDIIFVKSIFLARNTWLVLNVLTIYVLFGTYLSIVFISHFLDISLYYILYPLKITFATMTVANIVRNPSVQEITEQ